MSSTVKAWIGGSIVFFVLGFLWYEVLMKARYTVWEAEVARAELLYWVGLVGYLIVLFVMAHMYERGYEGGPHLNEGLRFGATIGVMLAGIVLALYSFMPVPAAWAVTEMAYTLVAFTLVGGTMGYVHAMDAEGATATA